MNMHDRYYEPEDNSDEDLLTDRICELLNDEYDITQHFHLFAEGITECSESDRESILTILQGNIHTIDFEQLGRKLWDVAFTYAESLAESHAIDNLNSGSCLLYTSPSPRD